MTKVFVAGATGVLGRRVVARLVAAGFDVTGVGRRPASRRCSRRRRRPTGGARPVRSRTVHAAVASHDVVCNLATAIPVGERANRPFGLGGQRPHPAGRLPQPGGRRTGGGGEPLRAGVDRLPVRGWGRSAPGRVGGARSLRHDERRPRGRGRGGPVRRARRGRCRRCASGSSTASTAATPSRRSKRPGPAGRWSWGRRRPSARRSPPTTRRRRWWRRWTYRVACTTSWTTDRCPGRSTSTPWPTRSVCLHRPCRR